jgi:hypothetical protein
VQTNGNWGSGMVTIKFDRIQFAHYSFEVRPEHLDRQFTPTPTQLSLQSLHSLPNPYNFPSLSTPTLPPKACIEP